MSDDPQTFAATLLANAERFSVGMYLAGLSGLAFLWLAWALRDKLRQEGTAGLAEAVAFGSALVWGTLAVAARGIVAVTAPVIADYFNDPEGARLVTKLEVDGSPLALTVFGAFAVGNGLALDAPRLFRNGWRGRAGRLDRPRCRRSPPAHRGADRQPVRTGGNQHREFPHWLYLVRARSPIDHRDRDRAVPSRHGAE